MTKLNLFNIIQIPNKVKKTSQTKLYNKLGLEKLYFSRWFRRLCTVYMLKTQGFKVFLFLFFYFTPPRLSFYDTHQLCQVKTYCRISILKYSSVDDFTIVPKRSIQGSLGTSSQKSPRYQKYQNSHYHESLM